MVKTEKHGIEGKLRNDYKVEPDNIKSFRNIKPDDKDFSLIAIVDEEYEKYNKINLKVYKTNKAEEEILSDALNSILEGKSLEDAARETHDENGLAVVLKWFEERYEEKREKLKDPETEKTDDSIDKQLNEIKSFIDGNEINESVKKLIEVYNSEKSDSKNKNKNKTKKSDDGNKYFHLCSIYYSGFENKIKDLTSGDFIIISNVEFGEKGNEFKLTDNSEVTPIKNEDAKQYLTQIKKVDKKDVEKFHEDKLKKMHVDKNFSFISLVEKIQNDCIGFIAYDDNSPSDFKLTNLNLYLNPKKKQELKNKEEYSPGDIVLIWQKKKNWNIKKIKQKDEGKLLNYLDVLEKISKEDFEEWAKKTREDMSIEKEEIIEDSGESINNPSEDLNKDNDEERFKELLNVSTEIIYLNWRINNINPYSKEFSREIANINQIFESYQDLASFINSDSGLKELYGENIITEDKIRESERFLKKTNQSFKIIDKDFKAISNKLSQHKFKVESYNKGVLWNDNIANDVDVLEYIKNSNIEDTVIYETIKPTIRYGGKIIMNGQVIVESPNHDGE